MGVVALPLRYIPSPTSTCTSVAIVIARKLSFGIGTPGTGMEFRGMNVPSLQDDAERRGLQWNIPEATMQQVPRAAVWAARHIDRRYGEKN